MKEESQGSTGSAVVQRILALDLGIGSYGIALQEQRGTGNDRRFSFPIVRSCTVPEMHASMEDERKRRRMFRTRKAHKAREEWLREVFETNGLKKAVLHGRKITETRVKLPDGKLRYQLAEKGDYKLEREFPPHLGEKTNDEAPNDEVGSRTVYCGAALRCLLLLGEQAQIAVQGRPLEDWQIFKALHSAIQKRGYDPQVPWARVNAPAADASKDGGKPARKASKYKTGGIPEDASEEADTEDELSEEKKKQREEEAASLARSQAMRGAVAAIAKDDPRYMHPCFWEASRMGLWDVENAQQVRLRCENTARSAKWDDRADPGKKPKPGEKVIADANQMPAVFPREMVEAEFTALCHAAEALLPQLAGKARFIAYGPPEIAYPNIPRRDPKLEAVEKQRREVMQHLSRYKGEGDYVRGKEAEWNAALGQKAPTFDNRCVGTCALLPRYNVAKCDLVRNKDGQWDTDSLLAAEVSFLLQVKNFRFVPELEGGRDWLNAEDMRKLYADHFHRTVLPGMESPGTKGAITEAKMSDWLEDHFGSTHTPKPGQDNKTRKIIIEKPRKDGRSRFSRPALRLLRALLLSGLPPTEFQNRLLDLSNASETIVEGAGTWGILRKATKLVTLSGELNTDEKKGLVAQNLRFLESLGESWEKISVRDERLEKYSADAQAGEERQKAAIADLIQRESNPRIRHRLLLLDQILTQHFMSEQTRPHKVVLEFAREEFMGKKSEKRKKLDQFQEERREERDKARLELGAEASEKAILKWQLCREQKGKCFFCERYFSCSCVADGVRAELSMDYAEICHIVPRSEKGPLAYLNVILGCQECNRQQAELFPANAFAQGKFKRSWDSFVSDVKTSLMRPFKKKLLCTTSLAEAQEMVNKRTALQETAWIAKLARTLICLKYGWPLDFEGQKKHIAVVTGTVTNRVAKKYELYSLLGGEQRAREHAEGMRVLRETIAEIESCVDDETLQKIGDRLAESHKLKKAKAVKDWEAERMLDQLHKRLMQKQDELLDKFRTDKRHHALDAMVLSFLPDWAGDPSKSLRFRLPKDIDWKKVFRERLASVFPERLINSKPELEQSLYGARRIKGTPQAVPTIRRVLRKIAYTGLSPKYSLSVLQKTAERILDPTIRKGVLAFAKGNPDEAAWQKFCDERKLEGFKHKAPGIERVRCSVSDDLTEFGNFAKEGKPAYRKGSEHQGWFICESRELAGRYEIEPVYVHQSKRQREKEITSSSAYRAVFAYVEKGDWVKTERPVTGIKQPLPAGIYFIRSVKADGRPELTSADGDEYGPIHITKLIEHGLKLFTP